MTAPLTIHAICHYLEGFEQVLSSVEFAKNGSGALSVQNWRNKRWVLYHKKKNIKISKTSLLGYYKRDAFERPHNEAIHDDVLLSCSSCNRLRRFELRSRETCSAHHDTAFLRENRPCSDTIPNRCCILEAHCTHLLFIISWW